VTLSSVFIRRPIFASVISIVIVIIGSVALLALPIARYPEIAPPTVSVTAVYPGADAITVAETVATPIEREVNGVENMIYMSSSSSADGQMTLNVTFEVGTDLDIANVLVQNRVAIAEPKLPEEVRRQGVTVKKKSTEITLLLTLISEGGLYDPLFLSDFATQRLKDELLRVPGVGDVVIFGAGEYGMRVWLDPGLLQSRGLTTGDIVAAIREQNVQVAAGRLGAEPAPEGQATQLTVTTRGRLTDPEEFAGIIVKVGEDGAVTRLGEIARIELGAKTYDLAASSDNEPAAAMAIYQSPGANAIEVSDGVRSRMDGLAADFPESLRWSAVFDSTDVIRASIREVVITLFVAMILVILTVYVFLQSVRATLIPAATIPVSLIGTFAVMVALGFSINLLTLFGLVLAIGIVVDDAIVVVENTTRHLDESGLSPKAAAEKAMSEVTGPVIATTLVLLAVFVPTAFLPGLVGQLYRQFALTISIATVFSSINALTLSPALAGVLLRPTKQARGPFRLFNRAFDAGTEAYTRGVRMMLRGAVITLPAFIGLGVFAVLIFGGLPKAFIPQEDEGYCIVNIQLPDAASLQRNEDVVEEAVARILDVAGVRGATGLIGFSVIDNANTSNTSTIYVTFDDWSERGTAELHQSGILANINRRLAEIPEAVAIAFAVPSLPGLGSSGGLVMMVEDRAGLGLPTLETAVRQFVADGSTQSSFQRFYTPFRANTPQIRVDIDREQVKSMGVALQDVFDTLGAALGSAYVNDFTRFGTLYQVRVQAEPDARADPDDIRALQVRNRQGEMLPLGSVVNVEETVGPQTITRFNVYPSAKVIGTPAEGFTSGEGIGVMESMAETTLPPGMGYDWTEMAFQEKRAGSAAAIFFFAIVLVYLVLAAQYESWTIPISVGLSILTALVGMTLGLMARDMAIDAYAQIGFVLLIGLSAKSAILIVEFAKQLHEDGRTVFEAAVDAARLRFRAILMTALSFILGVIPLAIATGAGAESRKVIGTAVLAGMLAATLLGVLVVPMLYFVVQAAVNRMGGAKRAQPAGPTVDGGKSA